MTTTTRKVEVPWEPSAETKVSPLSDGRYTLEISNVVHRLTPEQFAEIERGIARVRDYEAATANVSRILGRAI